MSRDFNYEILEEIKKRWSPRAFDNSKNVKGEDIMALIEAARYAPSCFNEQPWKFIIADNEEKLQKMRSVLTASNQVWANKAPVLMLILSRKTFELDGKDNYWNMFDAGCAWGFLSLEATRRGIMTHAMGGFNKASAKSIFKISEEYNPITVVAVGYYGDPDELPQDLLEKEKPGIRKSANEEIF